MSPTPGSRRVALLGAIAFAAAAILPLAGADHAYSHRYFLHGRVLDADGEPVANTLVEIGLDRFYMTEGPCEPQPGSDTEAWGPTVTRQRTNEFGEFFYCYHNHAIKPSDGAKITVKVLGFEEKREADINYRKDYFEIRLQNATAGAPSEKFESSYTVSGRLWESTSATVVEGQRVYGLTQDHVPLRVKYTSANGTVSEKETTTNNYGDFAVRFVLDGPPDGGKVTVLYRDQEMTKDVDPFFRATDFKFEVQPQGSSSKLLYIGGGVVAAATVLVGAYFGIRFISEQRALSAARARSGRKRAQR